MPTLFGVDDNSIGRPLRVNSDGEIYTAGGDFVYKGALEEDVNDASLSAGATTLYGTAVPSGEIWYVTIALCAINSTTITRLQVGINGLASLLYPFTYYNPEANEWMGGNIQAYLFENDKMQVYVEGATAGDDLWLRYSGLKYDA